MEPRGALSGATPHRHDKEPQNRFGQASQRAISGSAVFHITGRWATCGKVRGGDAGHAAWRQNVAVLLAAGKCLVQLRVNKRPTLAQRGLEMAEIFYSGEQAGQVTVREGETKRLLDPRFDLCKHSPPGFAWGNGNSVSAQLSLALLADALQNDGRALRLHNRFNGRVVTMLPARWTMTRSRILDYADMIERRAATTPEDGE